MLRRACLSISWLLLSISSISIPCFSASHLAAISRSMITSVKCKSRTTVLLVQHPAPWSPWSPWATLIHLGPQFPECGYTKWTKQDQGGPGVDQGHQQDHGAGWWIRGVQDHLGPLKNIFLMKVSIAYKEALYLSHDVFNVVLLVFRPCEEILGGHSPPKQ